MTVDLKHSVKLNDQMNHIRNYMKSQSQLITDEFPIYVKTLSCNSLVIYGTTLEMREYLNNVIEWLAINLDPSQYVAYPILYVTYRYRSNGIHFRYKKDAMLFKLTLL